MFISSVFVALSVLSAALAGPVQSRQEADGPLGSIFFITNGEDKNGVVAMDIQTNGSLVFSDVFDANGLGGHGAAAGIDPIFTQGSVVVHQSSGLAAAVNPGSNTFQMFSLDPAEPSKMTALGEAIPSLGDFPAGLAFNDAGDMLCAINEGVNANVVCWKIQDGGKTMVAGTPRRIYTNQTTNPPLGPSNTIGTVVFLPDQEHILTTVKGSVKELDRVPGYLAIWTIDADSGDIILPTYETAVIPTPGGVPFSVTQIPGRFAFVGSDLAEGANIYNFEGGYDNIEISTITFPNAAANCWTVYSSKTDSYFVSDIGSSILNELTVNDDLVPTLIAQYNLTGTAVNEAVIADVGETQYMYILFPTAESVGVFRLDGPGDAVMVQEYNITSEVTNAGYTVDGFRLAGMALYTADA